MVAASQQEISQSYPHPGWVEQDPEEIWASQLETARRVLSDANAAAEDVQAIGVANQRETTIVWDRETGKAVYPAIVWQDRRTADRCEELVQAGHGERIAADTGLVIDSYFSATKLRWILENVRLPTIKTLAFGTVDSFLLWRLTGGEVHATDPTNASRTMLFDIRQGSWSPGLLEIFDVPFQVLPRIVPSSGIAGLSDPALFGAGIPIAGIAGDQQAAAFGQACFATGQAKCTYGTGAFLLLNTGSQPVQSSHRLLTTIGAQAGSFALEGSVFVAGAAIQWLRDELGVVRDAAEASAVAASVPDSGGVHVVPAFVGLGAPYWDPHARGAILGINRGTTAAHIVRATLESIALQVRDVAEAMVADLGRPSTELRADGGASASDVLMQMQADVLGVPVVRPRITETTALGAAYLAGLATGFWRSEEEIQGLWAADTTFRPATSPQTRYEAYLAWKRAVDRVR